MQKLHTTIYCVADIQYHYILRDKYTTSLHIAW